MDPLSAAEARELRALLLLDQLPGVGPRRVRRIVERFGRATDAVGAGPRKLGGLLSSSAGAALRAGEAERAVDEALERAARRGLYAITWRNPSYPAVLHHLADPPPVLFLRGRVELLGVPGVTVVGARRVTARSRDLALRLGSSLAEAGVPVVSGLALGVDGAAHRGALAAGGDTVAVLGTGADVAYPRSHAGLYREVAVRGLVVSEFLPGAPALPHHFPRRNRILAALGVATVVVEAGARSGSLITVDHALDLGREVWAAPGPIERASCVGSNRLLAEGARPLLSIEQLVSELCGRLGLAVPAGSDPIAEDPSDPAARDVLALLRDEPLSGDEVADRLGLPTRVALGLLTELELAGRVRRMAGMRFGVAA